VGADGVDDAERRRSGRGGHVAIVRRFRDFKRLYNICGCRSSG
jgi:hypothetical protein